ncbi:MAG TPA: NAD(P)-binding domain-containing protein [Rubricoccaceae bacterium]
MSDSLLVWLIGAVLAVVAVVPFVVRRRRTEQRGRATAERAQAMGLGEPVTLHPVIDPSLCLGCGACTRVCPEGDVLALVGGQAATVAPARCVGHGLCQRACPVDAITLVFGTATRGVELPHVRGDYQTNVDGLYIVGELGGMGLVRNAFEQGRQGAEALAAAAKAEPRPDVDSDVLDAVVVGAGPAGLAAAVTLQNAGLRYVVLEQAADLGGAVRHYPRRKLVLTRPFTVPGFGKMTASEISKEDLMDLWNRVAAQTGVGEHLRTSQAVTAVVPDPEGFRIVTAGTDAGAEEDAWRARRVVLALGRRGTPRRLGVPGEDAPHVAYALMEPEAYAGCRVLVVGGGDSAIEAAVALGMQPGTEVRLSYRRDALSRIKAANHDRFSAAVADGRVTPLWLTEVTSIGGASATLSGPDGPITVPADYVFVFAGGELPSAFLRASGVELDVKFGRP